MTRESTDAERSLPMITRRSALTATAGATFSILLPTTPATAQQDDRLQWAFETGKQIISSPTGTDGNVFIGSDDGNLYAINAETGDQRWNFEIGFRVGSSPTVADGIVFVRGQSLYAIDAETGEQQWVFESDGSIFVLSPSQTVVNGTVFFGSQDLYAVDAESGEQQWVFETYLSGSPTVADGTVFVGSVDNNLHAVNAETGTEEWAFETETDGRVESSPTVADGTVFVGSTDNNLYAIDAETGDRQWAFMTGDMVRSSPTVADGTVFVGSVDNNLYAVDAETGEEEWAFETGDRVSSSPTIADGTVFVGSVDNNLYAVDAETGEEEWAFETGDRVSSSPTVVDGTVFVGSRDGNLYAVDAGVPGSSEGSRARLGTLGHHGDWAYANPGSQQETDSDGMIPSFGAVSPPTLIVAGGGVVGVGMYAWRRSRQTSEDTDTDTATGATDTTTPNSPSDSATEDATGDSDLQERATELLTLAEEAEADGTYQQAADAYEEAITHLEQAAAGGDDDEESKEELKTEIEATTTSLASVNAVIDARESVTTTLQAAEQNFKEGIARYTADEQTVARIRFRQARDAFEEAQQTITERDVELLAQPIEVSFEQEATLPSMTLENLAVLDESTVKTLSSVDIESITDLEADPENEEVMPAVVSGLKESDEISSEETALLTILSWWYEGASREFTSETVISRRYEQADYGFNQST